MPVVTHVAAHPDELVAELCRELASPGDDPFATELVAVPTRGIERWLTQRIAAQFAATGVGDGICANVDFPSPASLVRRVLLAVPDTAASVAAWEGPALTAHLLDVIDTHLDRPWLRLLQRHLEGDSGAANRLAAAAKIARLYTGYARRRPTMVRAWAQGTDTGPEDAPLDEADRWQPELWRTVRARIGVPSLPELLPAALAPVVAGGIPLALPDRLAVYGLTATDPLDLEVLAALGTHRHLHLHLLHPSPELWQQTAAQLADTAPGMPPRDADPTASLANHPLLRSWAQDSRELQVVLAANGLTASPQGSATRPATLLGAVQTDILGNQSPTPTDLHAGDRSVQIHVCHGARRQVEVLRDAVLHVFAADSTLQPRDVVIMTPDLATFAPLLEAAFPAVAPIGDHPDASRPPAPADGLPDLRVRVADRSPAATNPLVRFVATVLDLASSRLEAGAVRELVTNPLVQQRFGFDADTAGNIVAVIDDTNVAWGLDATDRQRWIPDASGFEDTGAGEARTWRRGLDRALTGVFYTDSPVRVVADAAPLDGVEGQDATPVGHLAAIVDRIAAIRHRFATPMPMSQWGRALAESVRMLAQPAWGDDWQWDQLDRLLAETFPVSAGDNVDPAITLADVARSTAAWVDDRPSPLHFHSGDVTVSTLAPMRSVPYRVVCLLGMDDDRFPRASRSDGDDLLVTHEIVGDHDRGAQDRQLLLDAVMAAGDHLIVTYSGKDELTNAEFPPAVPIAELIDAVADMTGGVDGVLVRHPLQPFSETNFVADRLGVVGPWGFDPNQLDGAIAARLRSVEPTRAPTPIDWPDGGKRDDDPLTLDDLIAFLVNPTKRFVRTRLGFGVPAAGEIPDDNLPAETDGLTRWGVTERLLAGLLGGHDIDELTRRERRSDTLPPGRLGELDLADAVDAAVRLRAAAAEHGHHPAERRLYTGMVTVDGRRVEGSVSADPQRGQLLGITASRLKAKQRLRTYGHLVFLTALAPEVAWRSVLIGKRQSGQEFMAVTMGPLADKPDERYLSAVERLGDLVALYDEGHRRPLPLPCETAYVWQRGLGTNHARGEAAKLWETDKYSPESADPAHVLTMPEVATLDDLIGAGFEDYCARLWGPVLPLLTEANL